MRTPLMEEGNMHLEVNQGVTHLPSSNTALSVQFA